MTLPPKEDYYELLGVQPNASASAIKKAYRREVRKYHPDKHEGNDLAELAKQRLAALNEAYDTLRDPAKRREYDQLRGHASRWKGADAGPSVGGLMPRFFRGMVWMLGIAGFGILMRYLRNPRIWLIVAIVTAAIWFFMRRPARGRNRVSHECRARSRSVAAYECGRPSSTLSHGPLICHGSLAHPRRMCTLVPIVVERRPKNFNCILEAYTMGALQEYQTYSCYRLLGLHDSF